MTDELFSTYADHYWSLGNAIAGFAAVQNISFLLTYLGSDMSERLAKIPPAKWIPIGCIISIFAYALGLWLCMMLELELITTTSSQITQAVWTAFCLRLAVVVLTCALLAATTSDLLLKKKGQYGEPTKAPKNEQ